MSTNRFHRAAKDGMVEVLKEATRKECNSKDEQGMTPTLYAAFYGHLDALRVLCGRGGNPNKADLFGNTALHLAAAQGHKHIVTFLVNFDANIYCTDIDGRTAQELAGMNNKDDILRFLDEVLTKIETGDHKKAKAMKEKAKKDSEKRIKAFQKLQLKNEQIQERMEKKTQKAPKNSVIETLKSRIKSGSMSNLSQIGSDAPRNSFSALVSGNTISAKNRSTLQRKLLNRNNKLAHDDDFKVSEIEDGKRTISSLKGYRRDSEILYSGTIEPTRRGKLEGVFNETKQVNRRTGPPPPSNGMSRSLSQPDFMEQLREEGQQHMNQEPASIFVRPGIGSIAFRKSITHTFSGFNGPEMTNTEESSIGSGDSNYGQRNLLTMDDELSDVESSDDDNPNAPLERFLTAWGLCEYLPRFEEQKIDLETLMLLTESDLKTLNLPLGPHRKLITAINERKSALENPGEVIDSML